MRLESLYIALLVALVVSACAAPRSTYAPQSVATVTVAQPIEGVADPVEQGPPPLLWRVEGPNGPTYLFGTMHFGVSAGELAAPVTDALASSTRFVLEADPTSADPVKLADLMVLEDGPSLEEQLGEARWKRLVDMLEGQFEERVANWLRPWVLEAVLIQKLLPTERPMELALLDMAKSRGMKIAYLEDWETQIALLNEVSHPTLLIELVDDPDGFRERTRAMSRDYVAGDLVALERTVFAPGYSPDQLFESRNREWLPRIAEFVGQGNVFVAVGAGHLLGPDSVIVLLENEGFQVTRIE